MHESCGATLGGRNESGYCEAHRGQNPEVRAKKAAYRAAHKEHVAAYGAAYYASNRDRVLARNAEYRATRLEPLAQRAREYYAANKSQIAVQHAEYYASNRERHAAWGTAWNSANPDVARAHRTTYRARKRGVLIETPTRSQVWARTGGQCHICLRPVEWDCEPTWHADHVVPLHLGGVEHIENLAPTHAHCNGSKGTKIISQIPWVEQMAWDVCIVFHLGVAA